MNTNWVSRQDKEGIKGIYDIYTVCSKINFIFEIIFNKYHSGGNENLARYIF
jgi:hypothetical protein